MKKMARPEDLLRDIRGEQVERFASLELDWVERGILHSEMLAVCAVAEQLGARRIVETGRYLGQSTLALARYFRGRGVEIVSLELFRNDIARRCERRLSREENVQLLYGDAFELLPGLLLMEAAPTLLLMDGPKGAPVVALAERLLASLPHLRGVFVHDCYKGSLARSAVEASHTLHAFTDAAEYSSKYAYLDEGLSFADGVKYSGSPDTGSGHPAKSYGPTLALLLGNGLLPPISMPSSKRLEWKTRATVARWVASARAARWIVREVFRLVAE